LSVPADEPLQRAEALYRRFVFSLLGFFALLFVALNLTLYQLVVKPVSRANLMLRKMTAEDALTGVCSRRHFLELLEKEVDVATLTGQPFSIVSFDVDHFKRINDTYGHATGDEVLRELCRLVSANSRQRDTVGRLGGEGFAILLPDTALPGANQLALTLCNTLAAHRFATVGQVTASFGMAE
jgi:diguanylate cyclase (GGDEF)-like protein